MNPQEQISVSRSSLIAAQAPSGSPPEKRSLKWAAGAIKTRLSVVNAFKNYEAEESIVTLRLTRTNGGKKTMTLIPAYVDVDIITETAKYQRNLHHEAQVWCRRISNAIDQSPTYATMQVHPMWLVVTTAHTKMYMDQPVREAITSPRQTRSMHMNGKYASRGFAEFRLVEDHVQLQEMQTQDK